MAKKIFQPSTFWSEIRFITLFRLAMIVTIFLISFEGMARIAPFIVGKDVHRPFTVSKRPCEEACSSQDTNIIWRTNERGARGNLYQGKPIQIAVLGTSTSSNSLVTQELTWPERLRKNAGEHVHVDNFARDGTGNKEMESILAYLIDTNRRYDAILIMDHFADEEKVVADTNAFSDWARVTTEKRFPKSPFLVYRSVRSALRSDGWVGFVYQHMRRPTRLFKEEGKANTFTHPPPIARSNRKLRQDGKVRLVDLPVKPVTDSRREYIQRRVAKLHELAIQVTSNVYFITQPVAYDDQESPGVSKRWVSLYPISQDEPIYQSNRTIANGLRQTQAVVAQSAGQYSTKVLDLDSHMRPMLRSRDDLFFDKWHFSPQGCEIAGKFIADSLASDGVF